MSIKNMPATQFLIAAEGSTRHGMPIARVATLVRNDNYLADPTRKRRSGRCTNRIKPKRKKI